MLTSIGGSDSEDAVYQELITEVSVTAAQLTCTLNMPEAEVEMALLALERRGLASRTATHPPRFVAAPPDIAVDALLLRRQAELNEARIELERLVKVYRSGRRARTADELIEIVTGKEAVGERVTHLQRAARTSFMGFVKAPFVALDVAEAVPLTNRNISNSAIYDSNVMNSSGFLEVLQANRAENAKMRIHPSLPIKLLIADRETALLPLDRVDSSSQAAAVIVHSSGLLDALIALYERYWEASIPLPRDGATADQVNEPDTRILTLLLAGVTDEAISRQLGISPRTLSRRIQDMMNAAGAHNRTHLAWLASRNNWLA